MLTLSIHNRYNHVCIFLKREKRETEITKGNCYGNRFMSDLLLLPHFSKLLGMLVYLTFKEPRMLKIKERKREESGGKGDGIKMNH